MSFLFLRFDASTGFLSMVIQSSFRQLTQPSAASADAANCAHMSIIPSTCPRKQGTTEMTCHGSVSGVCVGGGI